VIDIIPFFFFDVAASLKYSSTYNQQDATLHNIFIAVSVLHVSGGFSAHHQGLKIQNYIHSIWYVLSLLDATASGSSEQVYMGLYVEEYDILFSKCPEISHKPFKD
jgi:Kef-type K+ transport system membrane component KefB